MKTPLLLLPVRGRTLKGDTANVNGNMKTYPEPLTLTWRRFHGVTYMIGGVTFLIGSTEYLPTLSGYLIGGWMFTIGSACFLAADLFEWWKNNRIGCCFDDGYEESFEQYNAKVFTQPKNTPEGRWQRAENGYNFALSALGSFLYLVGSVMFIPELNTMVPATWVFIFGSIVISVSQTWKLVRSRQQWTVDPWASGVDAFAGLGGLSYFAGSIYFLPQIDISTGMTWAAARWFVAGGCFYAFSGVCMCYRYFCTEQPIFTDVRGGSVTGAGGGPSSPQSTVSNPIGL